MSVIEDDTQYILIPKNEDGVELQTRSFFGKALKEIFSEERLINALDQEKTLIYKGNEYFIDIKI